MSLKRIVNHGVDKEGNSLPSILMIAPPPFLQPKEEEEEGFTFLRALSLFPSPLHPPRVSRHACFEENRHKVCDDDDDEFPSCYVERSCERKLFRDNRVCKVATLLADPELPRPVKGEDCKYRRGEGGGGEGRSLSNLRRLAET